MAPGKQKIDVIWYIPRRAKYGLDRFRVEIDVVSPRICDLKLDLTNSHKLASVSVRNSMP